MKLKYSISSKGKEAIHLKGFCYQVDRLIDNPAAVKPLIEETDFNGFCRRLGRCHGEFALAVKRTGELWAAVDRMRSRPLFYGRRENELFLSDDAYWVRRQLVHQELDPLAMGELWYMLFVLGANTLAASVRQLRAGEALRAGNKSGRLSVATSRYYSYLPRPAFGEDHQQLIERLDSVLLDTFERLKGSLDGRQVVVPLSGGLDSRLVACMLKRLGLSNVLCFTYGLADSAEAAVSRKIARTLGYPWQFVSYADVDLCNCRWLDARQQFVPFSANLHTLPPLLEDWIALGSLKSRGLIEHNAVICPGHTAAFTSGQRALVQASAATDIESLSKLVLELHSPRMRWQRPADNLGQRMFNDVAEALIELASSNDNSTWLPGSLIEAWNWQERQSKRIINMVRTYEFWGYQWRLPLWDGALMDFWAKIPPAERLGKQLFMDYLTTHSSKNFAGLFNCNDSRLWTNHSGMSRFGKLPHRLLHRLSATRYFFTDKKIEHMLTGSYGRYLRHIGRRIFSSEPVTGPWLQMEIFGCDDIWNMADSA